MEIRPTLREENLLHDFPLSNGKSLTRHVRPILQGNRETDFLEKYRPNVHFPEVRIEVPIRDMADCHHRRAVTLIEMLVVLGIIAVLAAVVVTLTRRVDNQSKEKAVDSAFTLLSTSLREYYELRGEFPLQTERNSANALAHIELMMQELRSVPESRRVLDQLDPGLVRSQEGLAEVSELRDPWGTVLDYFYDPGVGDSFPELISAGPDKRFGTADDISSKGGRKI